MTLSTGEIRRRFDRALESAGVVAVSAEGRANPAEYIVRSPVASSIRAYYLNITEGGRRLTGESRVQIHQELPATQNELDLIVGYDGRRDVFAVLDAAFHRGNGVSISV